MTLEGQNEPFKFVEMVQDDKLNDVADKFRAYRLNAEATALKLKEANNVIERLKTEINISRNVETSLRSSITLAENRLIHLQKTNTKILTVAERLHQSEKASLEIERKIGQIEDVIRKIKDEAQNLFTSTSNEINLIKKYEDLKLKLKNKESEINLLKIENETLSKQKTEAEMQADYKCKILENGVEDLEREMLENQVRYDQTLRLYKKQIEDNELALKKYERERKSFLEEFAMPKTSENSSNVDRADGTALTLPDDRSPKNSKSVKTPMHSEYNGVKEPFATSAGSQSNRFLNKRPKYVSLKPPEKGSKKKPQLEFLTSNSTGTTSSEAAPAKRRLFSVNCNHYMN